MECKGRETAGVPRGLNPFAEAKLSRTLPPSGPTASSWAHPPEAATGAHLLNLSHTGQLGLVALSLWGLA